MIQTFLLYDFVALLTLRLALGTTFIIHALHKVKHRASTVAFFESVGLHPGIVWFSIATPLELVCGIGIVVGFFTSIAALLTLPPILISMIIKMRKLHQGLVDGWELELLMIAAALALTTLGPGEISVDKVFDIRL